MKLFIANCTKHHQEFLYRIPELTQVIKQTIPIGGQVVIYQDSTKDILEYILKQHMDTPIPFVIPIEEVGKHRNFVGMIFSFDKPVPDVRIEETFTLNDEALERIGLEQRKEAAVALQQSLDQQALEAGANIGGVEQTIQEESKKGEQPGGKKLNESITVEKAGRKGRK